MTAWNGDPALKERIVARMHQHRRDDAFVQGIYQQLDVELPLGYRGCAVGCLLDKKPDGQPDHTGGNGWHNDVEREFGIPSDVAGILDDLFEFHTTGPDNHARASDFAVAAVEAIPTGADLADVAAAYDGWEETYVAPYDATDPDASGLAEENERAAKFIEILGAAPVQAVSDAD